MSLSDRRPFFTPRMGQIVALLLTLAVAFVPADAMGDKGDKKKKKKKKKEDDFSQLVPFPVGHGGGGIRIPQRGENGEVQMIFEIGTAFREDEVNLRMENLKIETFDEEGKPDMVIDVPKSVMDMKERILTSVEPVIIERTDFKITGGNATFNMRTRFSTFKGPVRMLIFNPETF